MIQGSGGCVGAKNNSWGMHDVRAQDTKLGGLKGQAAGSRAEPRAGCSLRGLGDQDGLRSMNRAPLPVLSHIPSGCSGALILGIISALRRFAMNSKPSLGYGVRSKALSYLPPVKGGADKHALPRAGGLQHLLLLLPQQASWELLPQTPR